MITLVLVIGFAVVTFILSLVLEFIYEALKIALFPVKMLIGFALCVAGYFIDPAIAVIILAPVIIFAIMWMICKAAKIV